MRTFASSRPDFGLGFPGEHIEVEELKDRVARLEERMFEHDKQIAALHEKALLLAIQVRTR